MVRKVRFTYKDQNDRLLVTSLARAAPVGTTSPAQHPVTHGLTERSGTLSFFKLYFIYSTMFTLKNKYEIVNRPHSL